MLSIELNVQEHRWAIDDARLRLAVERVLAAAGYERAEVSMAVVDNATIWELNRRHLEHDYPTDVLSFRLDEEDAAEGNVPLEGELIVSVEMAAERAGEFGWSVADELLLYVVHGALHLVGYDDHEPEDCRRMRAAERRHLIDLGVTIPAADSLERPDAASGGADA